MMIYGLTNMISTSTGSTAGNHVLQMFYIWEQYDLIMLSLELASMNFDV